MSISQTLTDYLHTQEIPYQVLSHPHTGSSLETAQAAHISGHCLAKTVVLEDDKGFVLAVIPASHRLDMGEIHRQTRRPLGLATEAEVEALFADCERGAVPPLGPAYGLETLVDECIAEQPEVYFEAGDHELLIQLSGEAFDGMLEDARVSRFSYAM